MPTTSSSQVDLTRLSASEVANLTRSGALSVQDYAKALLARVEARDSVVHGWAYLNPDLVLEQARALDAIPKEKRGLLHGVAVGVKDVILTKDMPTQFHSRMYKDNNPKVDANCIITLRQAGALIFGKTTTTEFAAVVTGGPACNPHNPGRTPGGSSSGSGATVADFQVPLALGTQTGGSTIRPGSYNGIYALKVTWGSISREGLAQYSPTCDTLGLYARSAADFALLGQVFKLSDDVPPPSDPLSLSGARIAFLKTSEWSHAGPGTIAAMEKGASILSSAGAEVTDIELPDILAKVPEWHARVLAGEGRSSFVGQYSYAKELMDPFIVAHIERTNKELSKKDLLEAYDEIAKLRPVVDEILAKYDAVITPSVPDEATEGLVSTGTAVFNLIWTVLHNPVINVPGFAGSNNMPIGLSVVGPRFTDEKVIRAAKAIGDVFAKEGGFKSSIP